MYAEIPREGDSRSAETDTAISRPGDRAVLSEISYLAGNDREGVQVDDFGAAIQHGGCLA